MASRQSLFPSTQPPNAALQARITAKRAELANLQALRDLSAQLATQMSTLETKLSTLRDGTEAVACVMANWEEVLRVIGLVGGGVAKVGKDGEAEEEEEAGLPGTLVRIPVGGGEAKGD